MTRIKLRWLLPLVLAPVACSDGPPVDIGHGQALISDYAASWDGYAEAYTFPEESPIGCGSSWTPRVRARSRSARPRWIQPRRIQTSACRRARALSRRLPLPDPFRHRRVRPDSVRDRSGRTLPGLVRDPGAVRAAGVPDGLHLR